MNAVMKGIQQAIDGIEKDAEEASWEMTIEIIKTLLGTTQSIASQLQQEHEPKVKTKTIKKTIPITKIKQVKRYTNMPAPANNIAKTINDTQRLKKREQELKAVSPYGSR